MKRKTSKRDNEREWMYVWLYGRWKWVRMYVRVYAWMYELSMVDVRKETKDFVKKSLDGVAESSK